MCRSCRPAQKLFTSLEAAACTVSCSSNVTDVKSSFCSWIKLVSYTWTWFRPANCEEAPVGSILHVAAAARICSAAGRNISCFGEFRKIEFLIICWWIGQWSAWCVVRANCLHEHGWDEILFFFRVFLFSFFFWSAVGGELGGTGEYWDVGTFLFVEAGPTGYRLWYQPLITEYYKLRTWNRFVERRGRKPSNGPAGECFPGCWILRFLLYSSK